MSLCKVRGLYDFVGDPSAGEISLYSDEILIVTRFDAEDGWHEGINSMGDSGLFPGNYVEKIEVPILTSSTAVTTYDPGWYTPEPDEEVEDFSDDVEPVPPSTKPCADPKPPQPLARSNSSGSSLSANRFFFKSCDSYILGQVNVSIPEREFVYVIKGDGGNYKWKRPSEPYTVNVYSPRKESKFIGIKSFIAYRLKPSFNNIVVSRRYKHFDWLYQRLIAKYTVIPIPPLPDKQMSGRYEEQFIETRRQQLQEFVNWMCRHPVLSNSTVWRHFLTVTDERLWKQGKRVAERDPVIGSAFCLSVITPPCETLDSLVVHRYIDPFSKHTQAMENAIKMLHIIAQDQIKRLETIISKETARVGTGFLTLSQALAIDEKPRLAMSSKNMKRVGDGYTKIAKIYEMQPKFDWGPLFNRIHLFRGILSCYPESLNFHKSVTTKSKEIQITTDVEQYKEVQQRVDAVSYTVMAEMDIYYLERDTLLSESIHKFIDEQIKFHLKIVDELKSIQQFINA